MMEHVDRLIDVLLEEELGGESPPDLVEKISGAIARRNHQTKLFVGLAAAAAIVVVAYGAWRFSFGAYPEPTASGSFAVVDGSEVRRGATIRTSGGGASIALGGYCRVAAQSNTVVRIEGKKRSEGIFLGAGGVSCEVDRAKGMFVVRTEAVSVSVTGTKFNVQVLKREGEDDGMTTGTGRNTALMVAVAVIAGSVSVEHNGTNVIINAGGTSVFAASGQHSTKTTTHGTRVTVTGLAKALGDPSGQLNPGVANATLTVKPGTKSEVVYYVYGWAGVILAKQADGKKAEVSGFVGKEDGKKTLTGKSVDVKIIVVEEGQGEGGEQPATEQPATERPATTPSTARVTVTGLAKALGDPSGQLNPGVPNATLTVKQGTKEVVYYVCGWAGVILAKQADGKKAEVSGVVGQADGKKTLTGKSVDVKIIVVEEDEEAPTAEERLND